MLWKEPALGSELFRIHPDLRRLLFELDAKIDAWGFPALMVTHLVRTLAQQEEFYWRTFAGIPEDVAREKARRKFSWHLCQCGADLRLHDYSPEQRAKISLWMKDRCEESLWEFLEEQTTGTGPHWHIARRDFDWRRRYEQAIHSPTGAV